MKYVLMSIEELPDGQMKIGVGPRDENMEIYEPHKHPDDEEAKMSLHMIRALNATMYKIQDSNWFQDKG